MDNNKDVDFAIFMRGTALVARIVLWYGFFIYVIFQYVIFGKYEIRLTHIPMYIALALIIVWPILKGWTAAAKSVAAFSGRVEGIQRKRDYYDGHRATTGRRGLKNDNLRLLLVFTVKDKKGKRHVFSIKDPEFADIDYIKQGDFVIHQWGSAYLEKANKSGDKDVLCLACGEMNRFEVERCFNCHRTLKKRSVYFNSIEYNEHK